MRDTSSPAFNEDSKYVLKIFLRPKKVPPVQEKLFWTGPTPFKNHFERAVQAFAHLCLYTYMNIN